VLVEKSPTAKIRRPENPKDGSAKEWKPNGSRLRSGLGGASCIRRLSGGGLKQSSRKVQPFSRAIGKRKGAKERRLEAKSSLRVLPP